METDILVAHLPFELRLGSEGGHGVDDEHVDSAGIDELLRNIEGLFAVVGLSDPEVIDIDTEFLGIETVEGMLGVDDGADAPLLLGLGDDVDRERGLTGGLRSVDFSDTATRQTSDSEGEVESDGSCGNGLHVGHFIISETHQGSGAEILLKMLQGHTEGLLLLLGIADTTD